MIQYLEENHLLHPFHHGFRQRHSTSTALLQMFDSWVEAFDNKDITAVLMLDMSAAFDLVDHDLLLQKMAEYGFEESALGWFRSYLSGRSQQVYVDGAPSDPLEVMLKFLKAPYWDLCCIFCIQMIYKNLFIAI